MRFTFSEDQKLFQDAVRTFLDKECTAAQVRALWETGSGRSDERWAKLAEMGLTGLLVPEAQGGSGMDEVDLVLLLEETGRAALPEPFVETAAVGAPLLRDCGDEAVAAAWLPKVANGEAKLAIGHGLNPVVADAHVADLLLLPDGDDVHAVPRADVSLERQGANDPARMLFTVDWKPSDATRVAAGEAGRALQEAALDRAAVALAAQQLGIASRLVELGVEYSKEREQFGVAIGTFQAVKHHLADVKVKIGFAQPVVYKAAYAVANDLPTRALDASHAKVVASAAALAGARASLQVHGGIGYTWEVDLHVWMKRAWALEGSWGTSAWHRDRIAGAVLGGAPVGLSCEPAA